MIPFFKDEVNIPQNVSRFKLFSFEQYEDRNFGIHIKYMFEELRENEIGKISVYVYDWGMDLSQYTDESMLLKDVAIKEFDDVIQNASVKFNDYNVKYFGPGDEFKKYLNRDLILGYSTYLIYELEISDYYLLFKVKNNFVKFRMTFSARILDEINILDDFVSKFLNELDKR